jgi:PE-PPE domain
MATEITASERGLSVLCIPGTAENSMGPGVTGMLANVTRVLQPRFQCSMVPYPAAYGFPVSEAKSIQVGVDNAITAIRTAPYPVVLLGYSQGAQIARAILAELAQGMHRDLVVIAAGLIADPLRPPGFASGPQELRDRLTGWGVAGQMQEWGENVQVWSMARPEDIICNAPGDSPIRALADWTRWMSITDPIAWGNGVLQTAKDHRFQAVMTNWRHPWGAWQQYKAAVGGVVGYLTGIHTSYGSVSMPGTSLSYCAYLAAQLNDNVH